MSNYTPTPAELEARGFQYLHGRKIWARETADKHGWFVMEVYPDWGKPDERVVFGRGGNTVKHPYRLSSLADFDLLLWMLGMSENRP